MDPNRKPSPEDLPGKFEERVFVGGNYDFTPTLRAIAQYVSEISLPERRFFPVVPLDYKIEIEETMDWDLRILLIFA